MRGIRQSDTGNLNPDMSCEVGEVRSKPQNMKCLSQTQERDKEANAQGPEAGVQPGTGTDTKHDPARNQQCREGGTPALLAEPSTLPGEGPGERRVRGGALCFPELSRQEKKRIGGCSMWLRHECHKLKASLGYPNSGVICL